MIDKILSLLWLTVKIIVSVILLLTAVHYLVQVPVIPHPYAGIKVRVLDEENKPIPNIPVIYKASSSVGINFIVLTLGHTSSNHFAFKFLLTDSLGKVEIKPAWRMFSIWEMHSSEDIIVNLQITSLENFNSHTPFGRDDGTDTTEIYDKRFQFRYFSFEQKQEIADTLNGQESAYPDTTQYLCRKIGSPALLETKLKKWR